MPQIKRITNQSPVSFDSIEQQPVPEGALPNGVHRQQQLVEELTGDHYEPPAAANNFVNNQMLEQMQVLERQRELQREGREYETRSAAVRAQADSAKTIISNMRG